METRRILNFDPAESDLRDHEMMLEAGVPEAKALQGSEDALNMLNNYASFVRSCRPLTIVAADSSDGFRLGGEPPLNVAPARINKFTRYFATIPLDAESRFELSLFTSFADDYQDPAWMDTSMAVMHSQESLLVQFVIHAPVRRAKKSSSLSAAFTGHGLRIESERKDYPKKESNRMWIHHKIGGYPFFYHDRPDVLGSAAQLLESGYSHLLQMSSPGFEDALPSGDWPFGGYMFHVL